MTSQHLSTNHSKYDLPQIAIRVSYQAADLISQMLSQVLIEINKENRFCKVRSKSLQCLLENTKILDTVFKIEYKDQLFKAWGVLNQNRDSKLYSSNLDYRFLDADKTDKRQKYYFDKIIDFYNKFHKPELQLVVTQLNAIMPEFKINAENNPLGPKVFMNAIRNTLEEINLTPTGVITFYYMFQKKTDEVIPDIYRQLSEYLQNYIDKNEGGEVHKKESETADSGWRTTTAKNTPILSVLNKYKEKVVDSKLFNNISSRFHSEPKKEVREASSASPSIDDVAKTFVRILDSDRVPSDFKVQVSRLQIPLVRYMMQHSGSNQELEEISVCMKKLALLLLTSEDLDNAGSKTSQQANIILKFFEGNLFSRKSIFRETIVRIDYCGRKGHHLEQKTAM